MAGGANGVNGNAANGTNGTNGTNGQANGDHTGYQYVFTSAIPLRCQALTASIELSKPGKPRDPNPPTRMLPCKTS